MPDPLNSQESDETRTIPWCTECETGQVAWSGKARVGHPAEVHGIQCDACPAVYLVERVDENTSPALGNAGHPIEEKNGTYARMIENAHKIYGHRSNARSA